MTVSGDPATLFEVTGSDGSARKLVAFPQPFWRFARMPIALFPFWRAQSTVALRDSVREALGSSPQLATWLDDLVKRPAGHFSRLAGASETSSSRRELEYAGDVLANAVIGHHTGRKGGIGLPLVDGLEVEPGLTGGWEQTAERNCPSKPDQVTVTAAAGSRAGPPSRPESRGRSDDLYELFVDIEPGIEISSTAWDEHRRVAELVATEWATRVPGSFAWAVAIAVDSMATDTGNDFFEVHAPARSFGPHVLGAAWGGGRSRVADAMEGFAAAVSRGEESRSPHFLHLPLVHQTTFHQLDAAAWGWFTSTVNGTVEPTGLTTTVITEVSPDRQLPHAGLATSWLWDRIAFRSGIDAMLGRGSAWRAVRQNDWTAAVAAFDELGEWVVAKPRSNYPWWDTTLPGVAVVWEKSNRHRARLKRMVEADDVVIERLNTTSIDRFGRSGEFRTFWLLLPPPNRGRSRVQHLGWED
jgi:hypothetical protein